MKGIINNIINLYEMQAKTLGVLVANTQKALEQSEKERKVNEQIKRVEDFVKDLNNMLTRFYFLKERKKRRQEQMTDRQMKALTEFTILVKTLARKVSSLLNRIQENRTFEEKIDKQIRELEVSVRHRLKDFDAALDETSGVLTICLINFAKNIAGGFAKLIKVKEIFLRMANSRKFGRHLEKSIQTIKEDLPAGTQDGVDNQLENLFNGLSISSVNTDKQSSRSLKKVKV